MEPIGLDPDAAPLGDFRTSARQKADAAIGSRKLLDAILRLNAPPPPPRKKVSNGRPRTWEARKMARRQIGTIQEVCAGYFGITVPDILGKARAGDLPKFRAVAMYLARELTTASYPDLALTFGGRDHTTVLSTITNIARQIEADPALARVVRELSALAAPQEEESIAA
jgi:hypothetical protein